ncbi:MAG: tRNA lysidine(34) synthetase TilS [Verrucomicrobiales bacterium]|nr:tRNA lysidine(34) synthetase TilS [Verrucomicrobiales bacterium]
MTAAANINKAISALPPGALSHDEPGIIAVSGGRDSMVLLHALHTAGFKELAVCHVNHGLRGEVSQRDEEFVREVADELGRPCFVDRVDVSSFARTSKQSIEAAARELRYRALTGFAAKLGTRKILLGHHSDDQVETVLINFFRGSGTRGLSGMQVVSNRKIEGSEWQLIRPFLPLPRAVIDQYVEEGKIPFREDASNREDFALRNRIRKRLVPILEEVFERDVRPSVLRTAELSRRMEEWAREAVGDLPEKEGGLEVAALRDLPASQRERLLLTWLRTSGVPDCGFEEVDRISGILLSDTNPSKVNLPGNHHVRRRAGILFLEFPDAGPRNPK